MSGLTPYFSSSRMIPREALPTYLPPTFPAAQPVQEVSKEPKAASPPTGEVERAGEPAQFSLNQRALNIFEFIKELGPPPRSFSSEDGVQWHKHMNEGLEEVHTLCTRILGGETAENVRELNKILRSLGSKIQRIDRQIRSMSSGSRDHEVIRELSEKLKLVRDRIAPVRALNQLHVEFDHKYGNLMRSVENWSVEWDGIKRHASIVS